MPGFSFLCTFFRMIIIRNRRDLIFRQGLQLFFQSCFSRSRSLFITAFFRSFSIRKQLVQSGFTLCQDILHGLYPAVGIAASDDLRCHFRSLFSVRIISFYDSQDFVIRQCLQKLRKSGFCLLQRFRITGLFCIGSLLLRFLNSCDPLIQNTLHSIFPARRVIISDDPFRQIFIGFAHLCITAEFIQNVLNILFRDERQQLFPGIFICQDRTDLILVQLFCPVIFRIFSQFFRNFFGDPFCYAFIVLEIFRQFSAVCFIRCVSDVIAGYIFSGQSVFVHTRSCVIILRRIISHLCMNNTESRVICRNHNILVNYISFGIRSVFLLRSQDQRVDIQISH